MVIPIPERITLQGPPTTTGGDHLRLDRLHCRSHRLKLLPHNHIVLILAQSCKLAEILGPNLSQAQTWFDAL